MERRLFSIRGNDRRLKALETSGKDSRFAFRAMMICSTLQNQKFRMHLDACGRHLDWNSVLLIIFRIAQRLSKRALALTENDFHNIGRQTISNALSATSFPTSRIRCILPAESGCRMGSEQMLFSHALTLFRQVNLLFAT